MSFKLILLAILLLATVGCQEPSCSCACTKGNNLCACTPQLHCLCRNCVCRDRCPDDSCPNDTCPNR